MAETETKRSTSYIRIGVWYDPSESFLPGLIQGLLNLEPDLDIHLFVRPADQDAMGDLRVRSGGRLRTVVQPIPQSSFPSWLLGIFRFLSRGWESALKKQENLDNRGSVLRMRVTRSLGLLLSDAKQQLKTSPAWGLLLLARAASIGLSLFAVYWCLYTVKQFLMAAVRSLLLPGKVVSRLHVYQGFRQFVKINIDPYIPAKESDCHVWLIPSMQFCPAFANHKLPMVLILPQAPRTQIPEASLYVDLATAPGKFNIDPTRVRKIPQDSGASPVFARAWLAVLREAMIVGECRRRLDQRLVEPWPRLEALPASPRDQLRVFMFLPQVYYGGVLQVTRELTNELTAVNAQRRRLHLTLGIREDQKETRFLENLDRDVAVVRMRVNPIQRPEIIRLSGDPPAWLADRPEHEFCFFSGAAQAALEADAWFSLIDRFPLPLLPLRPLGIFVHDVLQRPFPQFFDAPFLRTMAEGIVPTVKAADALVAGTPQTRDDVIAAYGVEPSRVRLIPVACNPHWHFGQVTPREVPRVRKGCILNVANSGGHKGGNTLLTAYAHLKHRLGSDTPQLAMCGFGTQWFSSTHRDDTSTKFCQGTRELVEGLGLREGPDVLFLGPVTDAQLSFLYQRSSVVVNSAFYDNGCLCLAEAAYFGKPVISSRYPAAEFHAQRFGYSARFVPVGDAAALADALADALHDPPATAQEIEQARARFLDPEFGYRRYAERFYDVLVQLAEKGRQEHLKPDLRLSA